MQPILRKLQRNRGRIGVCVPWKELRLLYFHTLTLNVIYLAEKRLRQEYRDNVVNVIHPLRKSRKGWRMADQRHYLEKDPILITSV